MTFFPRLRRYQKKSDPTQPSPISLFFRKMFKKRNSIHCCWPTGVWPSLTPSQKYVLTLEYLSLFFSLSLFLTHKHTIFEISLLLYLAQFPFSLFLLLFHYTSQTLSISFFPLSPPSFLCLSSALFLLSPPSFLCLSSAHTFKCFSLSLLFFDNPTLLLSLSQWTILKVYFCSSKSEWTKSNKKFLFTSLPAIKVLANEQTLNIAWKIKF